LIVVHRFDRCEKDGAVCGVSGFERPRRAVAADAAEPA